MSQRSVTIPGSAQQRAIKSSRSGNRCAMFTSQRSIPISASRNPVVMLVWQREGIEKQSSNKSGSKQRYHAPSDDMDQPVDKGQRQHSPGLWRVDRAHANAEVRTPCGAELFFAGTPSKMIPVAARTRSKNAEYKLILCCAPYWFCRR